MGHRRSHSNDSILAAVGRVFARETVPGVSQDMSIGSSTLRKWVAKAKNNEDLQPKRRGPPPMFPLELETYLCEWVVGMQSTGYLVEPDVIIAKASQIEIRMFGKDIGWDWYQRFLSRHPQLCAREAQIVFRQRNEVNEAAVHRLFETLLKTIIKRKLDATRIFNMDKTAFQTRRKSKRVVALRGSPSMRSKTVSASFHLSIVASGSAAGLIVPPLFILPGERLRRTVLDGCNVPGATITVTTSRFMNTGLFIK